MKKIPIKKAHSRVTRSQLDPNTLRDCHRDPGGRIPIRAATQDVLPIPAQVVPLRGVVKPSDRVKASIKSRSSSKDKDTKLSDLI